MESRSKLGLARDDVFQVTIIVPDKNQTLKMNYLDGNGQEGLVDRPLSNPLRVRATKTIGSINAQGAFASSVLPAEGVEITFTATDPGGALIAEWNVTTVADGIASSAFTLGSLSGIYRVRAFCASCVMDKEFEFTATAFTNAEATSLEPSFCPRSAVIGTAPLGHFRVKAVNRFTGPKRGLAVAFSVVTDPNNGAGISPSSINTDNFGMARAAPLLGNITGDYIYQARCTQCQANQTVSCIVHADPPRSRYADAVPDGNPNTPNAVPFAADPDAMDPDTGEPATPILRISEIAFNPDHPEPGRTFTTQDGERTVRLTAMLLPMSYQTRYGQDIQWTVLGMNTDSGDPVEPARGSQTRVITAMQLAPGGPGVPEAPLGRQFPMRYMVRASVNTPKGTISSERRTVAQDEIDKCRQEYVDLGIIDSLSPGNPLFVPTHSQFTPGLDGEYVYEYKDCFAHIYPTQRAQEVQRLRAEISSFQIKVKSGYRSPRWNDHESSLAKKTSRHMFGDAVDIQPTPETAITARNLTSLWDKEFPTSCPLILEGTASKVRMSCREDRKIIPTRDFPNPLTDKNKNGTYDVFEGARLLHLGR
ncbi:MAG: D-Ala-D-Ala carboxypeptidase family metallohydrolase [Elusimicrobiota bacterium]|jgi:hypothetical protein